MSTNHEIYTATDQEDHCLHVIDYGHRSLRFSAERLDDGDYMAADLSADQVGELIPVLVAWSGTNTREAPK
ncbi:hypothetical protein ACWIGW_40955 [Nocardia brasiliensis]